MAPYDPGSYGDMLRRRVVFMISAEQDKVIPEKSTKALWEATGRQRIVWYPCGHYTMAKYFLPALAQSVAFFRTWPEHADAVAARKAKLEREKYRLLYPPTPLKSADEAP